MMNQVIWIGCGGAIGAITRLLVGAWMAHRWGTFYPYATLTVNVIGSFLIGVIMSWTWKTNSFFRWGRLFLAVGVMGGLTTFSTFSMETVSLLYAGRFTAAGLNVLANLILGLVAVALGTRVPPVLGQKRREVG